MRSSWLTRAAIVFALVAAPSCVLSSRVAAGYGAIADAPGCGAVLSAIAVVADGVVMAVVLSGDELSGGEQAALVGLGADLVIGGIETISDCTRD